ncbi:hypothetical protein HYH02_007227 [Chlamydomonas schloesseri]|uniref:Uncharacterized protein n=1 Tax=Chlamydomonas schloesseri TaxID=2026947 RepID=A0A836B506_9CHLO|nr:hypothetical protein HYH02_007227 [Chlamydomonas schloesseri]|eukprot:KAG2447770.1 hypothetical protein HYH02_007227 [Chlamydomonas schloesseri]
MATSCAPSQHDGGGGYSSSDVAEALAELQQVLAKHANDPLGMDGYLFEVHVWATFNFDAAAKGLPYRARRYADGAGGDVDIRVYDLRDGATVKDAQLKTTGKHLFSYRYGAMDRVTTTTEHAHCRQHGVRGEAELSYGGAASLPAPQ